MKKRALAILLSLSVIATALPEVAVFASSQTESSVETTEESSEESTEAEASKTETPVPEETPTETREETPAAEESQEEEAEVPEESEEESVEEVPELEEEAVAAEVTGDAAVLTDGAYYKIYSALDSKKHLAVKDSSLKAGAITLLDGRYTDLSDVFKAVKNSDGTYSLIAYCSNLALAVTSGSASNNAEVSQQKRNTSSNAQKWVLKESATSGYLTIASYLNESFVLDIKGGKNEYDTQVQLFKSNNGKAQSWKAVEVANPASTAPEAGVYTIFNVKSSTRVVDVSKASTKTGANVWLHNYNKTVAQKFRFIPLGYGNLYTIVNVKSHHSLDAQKGGTTSQTNVWQWRVNGSDAQKWRVVQNSDGTYRLLSAASDLSFDLKGGKTDNDNNIWLFNKNNSKAQKWTLKKQSSGIGKDLGDAIALSPGYYKVQNVSSGKRMNVANASVNNGANIETRNTVYSEAETMQLVSLGNNKYRINTYASNGLCLTANFDGGGSVVQKKWENQSNQRWTIKKSASGASGYYLVSDADPGCVIGIGGTSNGADVKAVDSAGTSAQRWSLTKVTPEKLSNGTYFIKSALSSARALDVKGSSTANDANIQSWSLNYGWAQRWTVTYMGYSNIYKIINDSGLALDVKSGSTADNANVQQHKWNGTQAQLWRIVKKDGKYVVINVKSDRALDIQGGSTTVGANVWQHKNNNTTAQKWDFEKYDKNKHFPQSSQVVFELKANGYYAEFQNGSKADGTPAQIRANSHSLDQVFTIVSAGGGYYKIKNAYTGRFLDIAKNNASSAAGAAADSFVWKDTSAQKWEIKPTGDGDGTFYIISQCGGKNGYLTATSTATGTQLTQRADTYGTKQKWTFKKPSIYKGLKKIGSVYKYYDKNGFLVRNAVTSDGKYLTNKDGTVIKGWGKYKGYYYYFKAEKGRETSDQRPYLMSLFGKKKSNTRKLDCPNCNYYITVDTRQPCTVTVYTKYPGTNSWNLPVFSVLCSPGRGEVIGGEEYGQTDPGYRRTGPRYRWKELMGPSYGQYATEFHVYASNFKAWVYNGELFHSVACGAANDHNLSPGVYNLLGTRQSHGCIRLPVRYAYWIYEFVPNVSNSYTNGIVNNFKGGMVLAHPLKRLKTPAASTAVDPTDPAYTGNYGYTDTNKWYRWNGAYLANAGT